MKEIENLIDPIINVLIDNGFEITDQGFMFENYLIGFKKDDTKLSIHIVNQM